MKKALVTGLVLASVIFAAGCNLSSNSANNVSVAANEDASVIPVENVSDESTDNDRISDSNSEQNDSTVNDRLGSSENERIENSDNVSVNTQDESSPDFNHGYSISERSEKDMREIRRSNDIVHDADEALKYLQESFKYPDKIYTYVLTDTSDDDPSAFMWYKFTVYYENIPVENSDFTVIAFTDGTIVEGRIEFFRCTQADRTNILSSDEALDKYIQESGDTRTYTYMGEHYYFSGVAGENPYIYVYRYDCGKILENTNLYLNAQTGELIGMRPDAID